MKPASVFRLVLLLALTGCSREGDQPASNVIRIGILGDGTYVWNDEPIADAETLDRHWEAAATHEPQPEIRLLPNPEASYESVKRALEGAQKYGVTNLGFVGNAQP